MDDAARADLVEQNLAIVGKIARMIHPRVRDYVDLDELVSLGNAGLAEAASRFEPDRGAQFVTYAWYRIQGSIMDGLRKSSNLPRRVWAKLTALRAASDYLEHRAERDAGAVKSGAPPASGPDALAQIQSELSAIRTMYVVSLEAVREAGVDPSDPRPRADDALHSGRMAQRLKQAIDELPERERVLVTKHYWEGKNLLEAGAELGISKSWASRLHAQAVERLRKIIDDDG